MLKKCSRPAVGDDGPRRLVGNRATPSNPNRHQTASGREVGNFAFADVGGGTVETPFEEIAGRQPDLSFKEFWGAYLVAAAVAWEPGGHT